MRDFIAIQSGLFFFGRFQTHLAGLGVGGDLDNGEDLLGLELNGLRGLLLGAVSLLGLLGVLGEDNELRLVGLEALDVELERLLRVVLATVVNSDANGLGLHTHWGEKRGQRKSE